jgi:endoglucanase
VGWPEWHVAEVISRRPQVRVNQLGYLPGRSKLATLISDAQDPVPFTIRDREGVVVYTGSSLPWSERPEPTSGLDVHVLDFTGLTLQGAGFRIESAGQSSHPFEVTSSVYARLRADALGFFYVMRSGTPILDNVAPGYGGIALWQLLSTLDLLSRRDSSPSIREFADLIRRECRWQLDWLVRMQVPSGDPLSGLAFHRVHGTQWSPMPGWAHEDPTERVLHRPSTTATLHLAAVAAKGARLFHAVDRAYMRMLLQSARTAYQAARRHPDLIAPDDHARFGGGPYADDKLEDDFYWAAVELWLTTNEEFYRKEMLSSAMHMADAFDPAGFDFDRVTAVGQLDLALAGRHLADYEEVVETLQLGADRLLELQHHQPWGQPYAPTEGWHWGSNGRILNNLVVLAVAHLVSGGSPYADAVATGMDYLLGRNALGQSYITGHGIDYSCHQRARQFGHDLNPALPPPPRGALAGGANSLPHPDFPYDPRLRGLPPQCCYLDEPTSEVTNDICIRWNAPLVWVATYLSTLNDHG